MLIRWLIDWLSHSLIWLTSLYLLYTELRVIDTDLIDGRWTMESTIDYWLMDDDSYRRRRLHRRPWTNGPVPPPPRTDRSGDNDDIYAHTDSSQVHLLIYHFDCWRRPSTHTSDGDRIDWTVERQAARRAGMYMYRQKARRRRRTNANDEHSSD